MMASAPALTAALELIQTDARLVQLKLQTQEAVVKGRGHGECSPSVSTSSLVSAVTSSKVQQVQHQEVKHRVPQPQGTFCSQRHLRAVLQICTEHWQGLVQERLQAAQMLLPDIPLLSPSGQQQEDGGLQLAGPQDSPAWRQIGHKHSPWIHGLDAAADCIKLLYTAEDLLQALTTPVPVACCSDASCPTCSSHNTCSSRSSSESSASQQQELEPHTVPLTLLQTVHAPTRMWLQSFFACLHPDRRQVGLDDVLHSWYRDQQVQQARNLAASCSAAACREAARTGIPASERPWVWATALGLPACSSVTGGSSSSGSVSESSSAATSGCAGQRGVWWQLQSTRDDEKLQLLCSSVKQQALLVDILTCSDAQQTADSAHYFCFEEAMRAVLLAFSRDSTVATQAASAPNPIMTAQAPAGTEAAAPGTQQQQQRAYPPSGVLPFQGLSAYLAPLCYLYDSPAATYPVWHAMYCQYWCKLHAVSSSPAPAAGLPVLCRTFLDLLQEVDLEVYQHLGSLTATPLDLVFPWLFSAFAAHLTPSETLLLWDRVIGFDSLLPLPVLAVAVLTFRRDLVLAAETSEELAELLQDLGQLRVVPLLQALLFDA